MAYQYFQPNPKNQAVGDCVIRAICRASGDDWYTVYTDVVINGYAMADMPSSNSVWGKYLKEKGYKRYIVPDTCPDCYTISQFVDDHPDGTYIICTGSHVVTAIDGNYYDSWDSGNEVPVFYYRKEEKNG